LRLRQDIVRDLREPARTLHALARARSFCMERDRLSVLVGHSLEVLPGLLAGGDVQVRAIDELPVGGDAGMREPFPGTTATIGRRREDERCRSEANPPQLSTNDRQAPNAAQSPVRGRRAHPKMSERYVIVRRIPTES
jgi:hypothetical protein